MLPLVCIDVDGTLIGSSGVPTDAVWSAADAAIARGQHLALSTARGAFGPALEYAERLDPDGWHIFHAGAALVHTGRGDVRARPLGAETIAHAGEVAASNGWTLEYYSPKDYTVDDDTELAVKHAALLGVPHVRRTADQLDGEVVRVQFVVSADESTGVTAAMGDGATVTIASSPVMPAAAFVTVTPSGITKATAITEIARELGTSVDRVMMVGDGHNDLEAIAAVGHGAAMGNAEPEVKAAARHQVASVAEDGLAEALDLSGLLAD
jgi:Cof subfamily protein (haloacid dehalogenase superfamily)